MLTISAMMVYGAITVSVSEQTAGAQGYTESQLKPFLKHMEYFYIFIF